MENKNECKCNACKWERFDKIIGKLPLDERISIRNRINEIQNKEFYKGIYLMGLIALLMIFGFIGGLALFL